MSKKPITIFADEQEFKDFLFIKEKLDRKTESDTIRAMISLCKKILEQNICMPIITTRTQQ